MVLLFLRLVWGWQFFQSGLGKFHDISRPIGFFTKLGIPFPSFNAHLVAGTEMIGGLLLMLGLMTRFASIPLTIAMTVALLTADHAAVVGLFHGQPDDFFNAAPLPFLAVALVTLAFGAGRISLDALLCRRCCKNDAPLEKTPDSG